MIHLQHFLTSLLELDFPCSCITLDLRKALRVIFMKICIFGVIKNLCSSTTFSITHKQTQQVHSWIARGLTQTAKLIRSELNLQIFKNLHLLRAVNRQPWLPRGMTRRALFIFVRTIQAVEIRYFASTSFHFRANLTATS